jgi:epoxyqueuosine reductase QueG
MAWMRETASAAPLARSGRAASLVMLGLNWADESARIADETDCATISVMRHNRDYHDVLGRLKTARRIHLSRRGRRRQGFVDTARRSARADGRHVGKANTQISCHAISLVALSGRNLHDSAPPSRRLAQSLRLV